MQGIDPLVSVAIGVGLAAACGFRVFVPLLALGIAARGGHLPLSPGFAWLASDAAIGALSVATLLEIAAYYVPLLDNLLDALAGPSAVVAGIVASAAVLSDLPPLLKWSVALIGGGGAAGLVQATTTIARASSTALTAGFGNPILATAELAGAVLVALLALAVPLLCLLVVAGLCIAIVRASRRMLARRGPAGEPPLRS